LCLRGYFRHEKKCFHQMDFTCFHQIDILGFLAFRALNMMVGPFTKTFKSFESSVSFRSSVSFKKAADFVTTDGSALFSSPACMNFSQSSFICACLADLNRLD
jgi:hypothetical protein